MAVIGQQRIVRLPVSVVEMSQLVWLYHQQNNHLVYHTAQIGGMNREGFNAFLMEVGRQLNQDQQTFLIFDNGHVHGNADKTGENKEIETLPPIRPS